MQSQPQVVFGESVGCDKKTGIFPREQWIGAEGRSCADACEWSCWMDNNDSFFAEILIIMMTINMIKIINIKLNALLLFIYYYNEWHHVSESVTCVTGRHAVAFQKATSILHAHAILGLCATFSHLHDLGSSKILKKQHFWHQNSSI